MRGLLDFNSDGDLSFTEKVIGVMLVEKLLDAQARTDEADEEYDAADEYDPEGESEGDDEEF